MSNKIKFDDEDMAANNFLASVHQLDPSGGQADDGSLKEFEIYKQEATVLGKAIADPDYANDIDIKLFSDDLSRSLFGLMQKARGEGIGVDSDVLNELALEEWGTDHWVAISDANLVSKEKADLFLARMEDRFAKREAQRAGYDLYRGGDFTKAIERLGRLHKSDRSYIHTPKELAVKTLNMINAGIEPGIKTGFDKIDKVFGGLHKSDLIVIAGRPGDGKTALAVNMALNCEKPALFCSMEQPAHQIMLRLMSNVASVDGSAIRKNHITQPQREQLLIAADKLANTNLYIWDKPTATYNDLQREAKRMYAEKNISCIFVDYLGRMKGGEGNAKHEVVGDNIRSLKNLALSLNIPVVVLVQLNRQVDTRDDIHLSDLKDSADIEAESDMVLLMKRRKSDDEEDANAIKDFVVNIDVAKNRHGPCGTFKLDYKSSYCRFENQPDFHF